MRRFSDGDAERFVLEYLKKDEQGFSRLLSVEYVRTEGGRLETCGGCTLGDGKDCVTPRHYIDNFLVVCAKEAKVFEWKDIRRIDVERYSLLCMGWSEGWCSNSFGDYNKMYHCKYVRNGLHYADYASYEEFLAKEKPLD